MFFLKKAYKVLIVISLAVSFFIFYNIYLVDRSLINLQLALNEASSVKTIQDFERIKPFLRIPLLKEIIKRSTSTKTLAALEIVQNVASSAKKKEQIEDIKFYLKNVIDSKEKERGGLLSFFDRINSGLFKKGAEPRPEKLRLQIQEIMKRINSASDVNSLQQLYFDLESIYIQLEDISGAEEAVDNIIRLEPSNLLALKAKFNLAWAYKFAGQYEKAVTLFEQINRQAEQGEFPAFSKYQIADVFFKKGAFEEARDEYARLSAENPTFELSDLAVYEAGYISYYNLNDRTAALKFFSQLENRFPKAKIVQHVTNEIRPEMASEFRQLGYNFLAIEKYLEAIDAFNKAIQISPKDAESLSGSSMALLWLSQINSAIERARTAIAMAQEDIALVNSLFVYIMTSRYDEAIKKGEEIIAKESRKRRPEFYYNLGCAYLLKNNLSQAIKYFDIVLNSNRDNIPSLNNLGTAYWKSRKYAQAMLKFKEAVAINPKYAKGHFNLGMVYFYLNRLEPAYEEFKLASELDPDNRKAAKYLKRINKALKYTP